MPVLVSELPQKPGSAINNNDTILVVDPVSKELFTAPAEDFRGATIIHSTNAPTNIPSDYGFEVFINGDIFYQTAPEGILIYRWDSSGGVWENNGRLDGATIWTSDSIGLADLDESVTLYDNTLFDDGDYYFNRKRGIMYGPYKSTNAGFDFSTVDYTKFQFMRSPTVYEYVENGTDNYDNPVLHITSSNLTVNHRVYLPMEGDALWIKKAGQNGHGGFVYKFSTSRYDASSGANHLEKLTDGWGTKDYFRTPTLFSVDTVPAFDNNEYRKGDSVVIAGDAVIYGGYNEDLDTPTPVDVDNPTTSEVWPIQQNLQGSSILSTATAPVTNDSEYKAGEFIITTEGGTPRIHGPYNFGASRDIDSWPLAAILRATHNHRIDHSTTIPTSFADNNHPYITDIDGNTVMVAEGDTITLVYTSGVKEVKYSAGVTITFSDDGDDTNGVLDWGTATSNMHPTKTHNSVTTSRPAKNDLIYYSGDLFANSVGDIFGPYVQDAVDDASAWPFYYSLAPKKDIEIKQDYPYTIPTANQHADWGSILLTKGDIVRVYYNNSTRNKHTIYKVESTDSANSDAITWSSTEPNAGQTIYTSTLTYPTFDDNSYYTNDVIVNGSGIAYKYLEEQASSKEAWIFSHYVRSPKVFNVDVATFTSDVSDTSVYLTDQINANTSGFLAIPGDRFVYKIASTGKTWFVEVASVDHVLGTITGWSLSEVQNAKPSQTFEVATGQPVLNDDLYSSGDFAVSGDGVMYGPYVIGQITNEDAWPVKSDLKGDGILIDENVPANSYEIVVRDGELFLVPKV